jgi:hypothetical protein
MKEVSDGIHMALWAFLRLPVPVPVYRYLDQKKGAIACILCLHLTKSKIIS